MSKLCTLAVAALLGLHAQAQVYTLLNAPELPLPGVKKVAVLNFTTGYDYLSKGRLATDKLTQHLMDDKRMGWGKTRGGLFAQIRAAANQRPTLQQDAHSAIFSIAERGQLERVLAEQRLSNSGVVDDTQAAELGKVLGIDAMISGSTAYSANTGYKTQSDGKYTRTRTVKSTLTVKVISVNTAQILGIKTFEDVQEASAAANQTLLDESIMADNGIDALSRLAANWICPYFASHELECVKVKAKEFSDKAKEAREICQDKGDLQRAFAIYKEMYTTDPYCAECVYNMGTIAGGYGNYADALDYFKKAAELDEKEYGKFVTWAQEKLNELPVLASIGVEPKPVELGSASASASAAVAKAHTRGNKADKYKVFAMPSPTSEVEAQVPGDTDFQIIETQGEWLLIKLLGGKQGYINKDDVKL